MRKVQVLNRSRNTVILEEAEVAETFRARVKGLLGRKGLPPGKGLVIKPCRAVHTVGMSFPIDVGFVDGDSRICHLVEKMPPYRFTPTVRKAHYVIEAPAGTFEKTMTACGDRVEMADI